jgi:uncharacterized protein involved in response to NO
MPSPDFSSCFLPGTFLGVWNLISISGHRGATISASWIQAHGHAQIFGWIGTFILGIGFYSIPKIAGRAAQLSSSGWAAWLLWTVGVLLRWAAGFYHFYWRVSLPLSALLELCAFFLFLNSIRRHRPSASKKSGERKPVWIVAVLVGTAGFGIGLLMNLLTALCVSVRGTGPEFPAPSEARFLTLLAFAFIVPTIWGFSARWLPVFLGLKPVNEAALRCALFLSIVGVVLAETRLPHLSPWVIALAAVTAVAAFHLFGRAERTEETRNRFNLALLERIVNRGKIYLSNTEWKGKFCLRACIVNHLTKDPDIDLVVPEILDAASEIISEYQ